MDGSLAESAEGSRFRLPRNAIGLLLAIIAVVSVTAYFDSNYVKKPGANASEILRQTSLLGIYALGAAVVIIAGGIDLSAGSVIAFSGAIAAQVLLVLSPLGADGGHDTSHVPGYAYFAAIGAVLVVGFLVGTLHAWLITVVELPPFVATLASLVGLRSLAVVLNKYMTQGTIQSGSQISIFDSNFTKLASQLTVPLATFVTLAIAIWVLLSFTVVGRHLYALGGNEQAARLSGIRTDRLKWLAYVISATTASIAGFLYVSEVGVSDPITQGRGYELNAIAAAVVGGCSLQGGAGAIPSVVLGVLFLRVVIDAVAKIVKSGADDYEGLIVGFLVVLAVALSALRRNSSAHRKQFFPGVLGWVAVPTLALVAGIVGMLMARSAGDVVGIATGVGTLLVLGSIKTLQARQAQ